MIFGWLAIILVIYFLFWGSGRKGNYYPGNAHGGKDAIEILKQRYVNGEIDDAAYKKMLQILSD